MTVLELKKISKRYGKTTVVDSFDLQVKRGHICGLIGPNCAGKTTIMKLIAGLAYPTGGELSLFGNNNNLRESRKRMSFMLEAPIICPNMAARENLQYVRYVKGVADERKIDEVLSLTGITDTGKKRAIHFSLGMKQRLGIAMALLTEPEILVLDEPVNGLDPEGIVSIRHMLKRLNEEKNVTIVISSHILAELAELCTDYAIIDHGKLIDALNCDELQTKCRTYVSIRTDDMNKTAAVLESALCVRDYKVIHGEEIHLFERTDDMISVSKALTQNGLTITKLTCESGSLENYYLSKVGENNA